MTNENKAVAAGTGKRHPMLVVLGTRNLRLLWIGEGISVLGSQFYLIALPWMVLQMTGDPFQMGSVLALAGIPRALFMLVGGALTDRFSPRTLMIYSNAVRMLIVIVLSSLLMQGMVTMWLVYALSLIFGLADAFLYPAQSAIMPRIVDQELLLAGNSIVQGTAQLSIAAGPALAGTLIAIFSSPTETASVLGTGTSAAGNAEEYFGIAMALAVNACAFLISIIMFSMIKLRGSTGSGGETEENTGVFAFLKQGISYVLEDKILRLLILVASASHFLVEGPLFIGIPVLANSRFPEGAAAFGIIMSGLGGGMLLGIILAGTLPKLNPRRMGMTLLLILSSSGLGLMVVGFMPNTFAVAFVVLLMGSAQGYVIIQYSTWIQVRTPEKLLGRVMSTLIFASVGLIPVSQALCGALIKLSITGLFLGAGIILTIINFLVALRPEIQDMGLEK